MDLQQSLKAVKLYLKLVAVRMAKMERMVNMGEKGETGMPGKDGNAGIKGEKGEPGVDKNSNDGVKVSVTLYFLLKTEMTNFQSTKQKGKRMLYPCSNKGLIRFSLVVLTYE
ncbi:unnamed protein product [Porites evermanni]|uniref:Uncharacterized protein n=1 Tax=Porites evermanni TaxID=104178 RepID=A0ABN8PPH3_9CNID|nr:unnamed protein product [Porites evermanni]